MPRPKSLTVNELSLWIVNVIWLPKPAYASSIAFDKISCAIWINASGFWPFKDLGEPTYIPGRLRTAAKPLIVSILS